MLHIPEPIRPPGDGASGLFAADRQVSFDGLQVATGLLAPNPGMKVGSSKLCVTVIEGADIEVEWREPDNGRLRKTQARNGTVSIIPPGRPFYQRWPTPTRIMLLAFDTAYVDRIGQAFGGRTAADLETAVSRRDVEIERIAQRLRCELDKAEPAGGLVVTSLATTLLVQLFRFYRRDPVADVVAQRGLEQQKLDLVLNYIDDNLSEKLTLEELAGVAGLSAHHFSEAFKKRTGEPPIRFVIRRRVERAAHFLATTDRSISDIAHDLGFPSHSHLSTFFKRDVGTPPSAYRNRWRENGRCLW